MNDTKLSALFLGTPAPHLPRQNFAGQDSFCSEKNSFSLSFECTVWAETKPANQSSISSLSFLRNRPDNDTATETPDKQTNTAYGQLVFSYGRGYGTQYLRFRGSFYCLPAVQVCHGQLRRVTESWRKVSSMVNGEIIFSGYCQMMTWHCTARCIFGSVD